MSEDTTIVSELVAEGRAAFEAGQFRLARDRFSQAALRAPGDRQARFFLGATQYHLGNLVEARRQLEPLDDEGPVPVPGRPAAVAEYLSRCVLTSEPEKALTLARVAVARDDRDPRAHLALGHAYARLKQHAEALKCLDRAWELEVGGGGAPCLPFAPTQVPYARCLALCELQRWAAALVAADQAIARDRAFAPAFNQKGLIYVELERYEDAAAAFQHAVELDPETRTAVSDGSFYFNLSVALAHLGRRDEALAAVNRALTLSAHPRYTAFQQQLMEPIDQRPATASNPTRRASPPATFADVGGMRVLKDEVGRIVDTIYRKRAEARRYGIVRNGILLYGPPGCGKTFFAEAMAGEFGLELLRVPLGEAVTRYVGAAPEAMARLFEDARARVPCLMFFDEFDAIAGRRSGLSTASEQQLVNALLQQLDRHRDVEGLVIVAATNRLEALDPAVVREGRFDYKVKVDKPDFGARREILRSLLSLRPTDPGIDAGQVADETEGLTAAQLRAVVDRAALAALEEHRRITPADLVDARRCLIETHRYSGRRLGWDDIIVSDDVLARLQFIERAIEHSSLARQLGVAPPSGLLLSGPPGTGKTTIARVLASEIEASFFAVGPADIFSKFLGDSEQQIQQLFERARNHAPALIFFDEIDAVLGSRAESASGADQARHAVLNTFLTELDGIDPATRVLVVGATNRPDLLDEAVLRPGRLGEHVKLGWPDLRQRLAMLRLFAREMALDAGVDLQHIAAAAEGATGADLRGLCAIAGRHAFLREMGEQDDRVGVSAEDFERALAEWLPSAGQARQAIGFRAV